MNHLTSLTFLSTTTKLQHQSVGSSPGTITFCSTILFSSASTFFISGSVMHLGHGKENDFAFSTNLMSYGSAKNLPSSGLKRLGKVAAAVW